MPTAPERALRRRHWEACLATTHFAIVELARLMASVWKKLLMLLLNGAESAFVEPSLSATNAYASGVKQFLIIATPTSALRTWL